MLLAARLALAATLLLSPLSGCKTAEERASDRDDEGGVWTRWSEKRRVRGLLELERMRDELNENNLHDAYEEPPRGEACPDEARRARLSDGTCNDLNAPMMGAAGTRFGRNVPLASAFPEEEERLLSPSPREVSRRLLTRREFVPLEHLNLFVAAWIQFMVHDWVFHGDNETERPFALPLVGEDPSGTPVLSIPRTRRDPTRAPDEQALPPTYLNTVTHWWDASQVYGSEQATTERLRAKKGGRLKLDGGRLAVDADRDQEDTGFQENWWVGLTLMHTLFAKEHNAIADELSRAHPEWDDERLFQTARLVNAAVLAKIHTVEWTPAVLDNSTLERAMNVNWYGLLDASLGIETDKGGPVVSGLVGGRRDLHGVPYSLTEEFTSVYRMHPFLPESLVVKDPATDVEREDVPLLETRDEKARALADRHSMTALLYSFGSARPGALTLRNNPSFMEALTVKGGFTIDLAATDVLRDRERGVPRYNEFRRLLGLVPIRDFADLTNDSVIVAELRDVYDDVERIDLLVGCLAEAHRPKGFGFGETAFQIFILMASRRLEADRFFTDDYRAETYSKEGLLWVKDATFKSVLLRHHPELAVHVRDLKTGFEPWKVGAP